MDYRLLRYEFGKKGSGQYADINNDGRVDLADFVIMRRNFGFGVPPGAPQAPGQSHLNSFC